MPAWLIWKSLWRLCLDRQFPQQMPDIPNLNWKESLLNWLAHLLLSRPDIEYQLGNLLADPLKGKAWQGASESIKTGMLMHKAIDVFTDSHEIVSRSKSRLGSKGYLKGVVIDLLYDHYLANTWSSYSRISLDDFLKSFYTESLAVSKMFPDDARNFVTRLVESNRLAEYSDFNGFVNTLQRVDQRLSKRIRLKDSTLNYIDAIERDYDLLKLDFNLFFPELISFFKKHRLGSSENNYLFSN